MDTWLKFFLTDSAFVVKCKDSKMIVVASDFTNLEDEVRVSKKNIEIDMLKSVKVYDQNYWL